jgi:threonylcarbamoyladenosine tRNA methylthiotransferase MtaB
VVPRYYLQNFGCRTTQAEGAALAGDLSGRGLVATSEAGEADLVVLNTCTVTAAADQDARHAIRRLHRQNPAVRILVTGCYAQRAPQELAVMPGVCWVVGNTHKTQIGEIVRPANFVPLDSLSRDNRAPSREGCEEAVHGSGRSGARIITGDIFAHTEFLTVGQAFLPVTAAGQEACPAYRTRPNLKIQDGCNNKCSFCVIPSVRGRSRSLPLESLIEQARDLERAGYREIVLSGINLGRWGRDLRPRITFPAMLRAILERSGLERIRLSSVEPLDLSHELLELMAGSRRIARHVHAPLESGSDRVLRLMCRRYRARHYEERIRRAHAFLPGAAFGADVMVGFPGETAEDFDETRALIERLPLTYLHVFTYSKREGTPAAAMRPQVNGRVARRRNQVLRELADRKNREFRRRQIGRTLAVLTLSDGTALSDNYLKVRIAGPPLPPNALLDVRVTGLDGDGLLAEVQEATGSGQPAVCLAPPIHS